MEIILIILLTLINAFFAMSEIALTACRKIRLQVLAESGNEGAAKALVLLENPTQFLSTVQVGITCISIFNAIMGDSAFGQALSTLFVQYFNLGAAVSGVLATIIVVSIITFITVVFGELVPKRIGQLYPEAVACAASGTMTIATRIVKPVVRFFEICTSFILKRLKLEGDSSPSVTEEEINAQLEEGLDAGIIEKHEHHMVCNVFRLDNRSLASIMVPREDLEWLDEKITVEQCLKQVGASSSQKAHSTYPVCKDSLNRVSGILRITKLLGAGVDAHEKIAAYIEPAIFVPETLTCMELVARFRAEASNVVLVVDEYGDLQGLVTHFDLLEAITGELKEEDNEPWTVSQTDGSWVLDGLMPIEEAFSLLEIDKPPFTRGKFNTLGGFLMALLGHLPEPGEHIYCFPWRFTIKSIEGRRINQILAVKTNEVPTSITKL